MFLEVAQVSKFYGDRQALHNLSFSVDKAEVVGLLGPNGAGKSTLMKIICCYIPPSSGRVAVCGLDTACESLKVRSHIGYLPEHNPLYLDMYVREYLDFAGGIYMDARKAAKRREEVISLTGLGVEAGKKIGQLSKGYRQRVGLAQALMHEPDVLVLDEPSSGLDPNQLEEVRTLIREIGKQKTVILSTHIMQEVEAVCDRVLLLNGGCLVADAPTHEIMRNMGGGALLKVEFDREIDIAEIQAISGVGMVRGKEGACYEIQAAASVDLRPLIFRFAVEKGLSVLTLQREENSLEAVFHRLTRETTQQQKP